MNEINNNSVASAPIEAEQNKNNIADGHIGHELVKEMLYNSTCFYLDKQNEFDSVGIQPDKGILLYGVSGTGKSTLAWEVARTVQARYTPERVELIEVRFHDFASQNVGVASKKITDFFIEIRKSPKFKILIMDEMESLAPKRHLAGVLATERTDSLLKNIDYLPNVFIFAMTNHKEKVDESFLRDGRLGDLVELTPPTYEDKLKFIERFLKKNIEYESNVNLNIFIHDKMVGADFKYLENKLFTRYLQKGKQPLSSQDITIVDMHLTQKINQRGE